MGLYEIGAKIANIANYLPAIILPILNPTISDLHARGKQEEINLYYQKGLKILTVITIPITFLVMFYAEEIVMLWIGKTGFEASATAARFLVLGISFYMIAGVGRLMARGINFPHYEMQTGLLISILNIILSYFLIIRWGIGGAVIASSFSLLVGSIFFLWKFNKKLNIDNKKIFYLLSEPIFFSLISIIPTIFIPGLTKFYFLSDFSLRILSFFHLFMVSIVTLISYVFLIYFTGYFKEEYQKIISYIRLRI